MCLPRADQSNVLCTASLSPKCVSQRSVLPLWFGISEKVLTELGLNMATTIRLFLKQIAREKSVPLSLSLAPAANSYQDALSAREARLKGYAGQDADDVIEEMEALLRRAEK